MIATVGNIEDASVSSLLELLINLPAFGRCIYRENVLSFSALDKYSCLWLLNSVSPITCFVSVDASIQGSLVTCVTVVKWSCICSA